MMVILAGPVQADFILTGTQHLDVITSHVNGYLYDSSTADIKSGGYVLNAYVDDDALLRVSEYYYGTHGESAESILSYKGASVNLIGGSVRNVYAYDNSYIDISGGDVGSNLYTGHLYAYDNSTVNLSSGSIDYLTARVASSVDIVGGSLYVLQGYDVSNIVLSGGSVDHLKVWDTVTAAIVSGGNADHLLTYGTSSTTVSGGNVSEELNTNEASTVNISAGTVGLLNTNGVSNVNVYGGTFDILRANDNSHVNISSDSVISSDLHIRENSSVTISSGNFELLRTYNTSNADISGGDFTNLYAWDTSSITLHGYDFQATGGLSLIGEEVIGSGVLTGKWHGEDTEWIITIQGQHAGASILAVPEPATLPGDVNGDGWVSGTDLSIIINYWGQSLGREFGDLNGNGVVDGPDYTEVLSYWNPPPAEPTPEPATLGLLLLGGLALLRRRK